MPPSSSPTDPGRDGPGPTSPRQHPTPDAAPRRLRIARIVLCVQGVVAFLLAARLGYELASRLRYDSTVDALPTVTLVIGIAAVVGLLTAAALVTSAGGWIRWLVLLAQSITVLHTLAYLVVGMLSLPYLVAAAVQAAITLPATVWLVFAFTETEVRRWYDRRRNAAV